MGKGLDDKLVLAISSRALFDLDESHRVYEAEGIEAYRQYQIEHVVEGDSMGEVLAYVQYDRRTLSERVRRAIEAALQRGDITLEESARLRRRYDQGLSGYTYLDRPD